MYLNRERERVCVCVFEERERDGQPISDSILHALSNRD